MAALTARRGIRTPLLVRHLAQFAACRVRQMVRGAFHRIQRMALRTCQANHRSRHAVARTAHDMNHAKSLRASAKLRTRSDSRNM